MGRAPLAEISSSEAGTDCLEVIAQEACSLRWEMDDAGFVSVESQLQVFCQEGGNFLSDLFRQGFGSNYTHRDVVRIPEELDPGVSWVVVLVAWCLENAVIEGSEFHLERLSLGWVCFALYQQSFTLP